MDALQYALSDPQFQAYLKQTAPNIPNPVPGQQPADKVGFGGDFTQTNTPAQTPTPLHQQTQAAFQMDAHDPPGQVATQEQDATFGNISAAIGNAASVATGGVLGALAGIATNNQSFSQAMQDIGKNVKDSMKGFFSGLFGDDDSGLKEGNPSKSFDSKSFGIDPGLPDVSDPTKDSKSISQSFADDTAGMFDGAINGITGQKGTPATPSEIAGFKVGALGAFDPDDPSNPGQQESKDKDSENDGKSTDTDPGPSSPGPSGNNGSTGNGNGQDGNGPNGGPSGGSGPGGGAPGGPSGGAPGGVSGSDPY